MSKSPCLISGVISKIKIKNLLSKTKESSKGVKSTMNERLAEYAVATITTLLVGENQPRKIPILALTPTAVAYIKKTKEGEEVNALGKWEKVATKTGQEKLILNLIGQYTNKEKRKDITYPNREMMLA
jgi:hypothetical protein